METPDGTQIGSGYAADDALAALTLNNCWVSAKCVRIARWIRPSEWRASYQFWDTACVSGSVTVRSELDGQDTTGRNPAVEGYLAWRAEFRRKIASSEEHAIWFSRPPPSTTRPSLRRPVFTYSERSALIGRCVRLVNYGGCTSRGTTSAAESSADRNRESLTWNGGRLLASRHRVRHSGSALAASRVLCEYGPRPTRRCRL